MDMIDGAYFPRDITPDALAKSEGSVTEFCARVAKIKNMGEFSLLMLRAGRYVFQAVYDKKKCECGSEGLCAGAYVSVSGIVRKEGRAEHGFEITLSKIEILSVPDKAVSAIDDSQRRAVFKISEGVVTGFCAFMLKNGFTEIRTPKIVPTNIENDSHSFRLKYFGQSAYLLQNPQPYKQICAAEYDRVFEVTQVHRAEKHNSARHLNEYVRLDFEIAYADKTRIVMNAQMAAVKYIIGYLEKNYGYELGLLGAKLPKINKIPSIAFDEALKILGKPKNQPDLDPTDEVKLCRKAEEKFGSQFIFAEKFPEKKQPYCVRSCADNPVLTESFVLLFKGMEIASGGLHIHSYDEQLEKLKRRKIDAGKARIYLDAYRIGLPPSGGAALGLERFVMKLLDLDNIRKVSMFPRDLHCFKHFQANTDTV